MKKIIILLLLSFMAIYGYADDVHAISGNADDVQDAFDAANPGDCVVIPAGTWDWDARVSTTKAVSCRGAGRDLTILVRDYGSDLVMFSWIIGGDTLVEIYDFEMAGIDNTDNDQGLAIIGTDLGGSYKNVRIHHCDFRYFGYYGILFRNDWHMVEGLVDHCRFYDIYKGTGGLGYGVSVMGCNEVSWAAGWTPGVADNNVFIEDCYFYKTRHAIVGNGGARLVGRYNTIEENKVSEHALDAHGDPHADCLDDNRGTRSYEYYENHIDGKGNSSNGIQIRGGDGIIANNTMVNITVWGIHLQHDNFAACDGCGGYPCRDQIRDLYIWGNTRDGFDCDATYCYVDDPPPACDSYDVRITRETSDYIQLDRDFYLEARPAYSYYTYPHPLQGNGESILRIKEVLRIRNVVRIKETK